MDDDVLDLHQRALDGFGQRVHAIGEDQWRLPTPCTEWDVRTLVGHLVGEQLWAAPLLGGATLEQAARLVPDDPLGAGEDPVATWAEAADAVRRELEAPGVLARTVHLSYGDVPARSYVTEMTFDLLVHSWDLARAVGADESLDPGLVQAGWAFVNDHGEDLVSSGLFAAPVDVPDGADTQTRVLAATGRRV